MYYRRKIIFGLLEMFEGKLNKTDFQKLLLILSKHQEKPSFEFVPYKYGCFSFQSYADIRTMIKYEQIKEEKSDLESFWVKTDPNKYHHVLKKKDQQLLEYLKRRFSASSTEDIIKYTYRKYPYYAINSTIAEKLLNKEELNEVYNLLPSNKRKALYTIGYEGISQENYLNRLIRNNIKILCDVRRNPLSMKYGFSKNQLLNACKKLGIEYIHVPEVGIPSGKRKKLETQKDYDELFEDYNNVLTEENSIKGIKKIKSLLEANQRIAVTCFEANIHQCHRKHLAIKLIKETSDFEVIHI